MPQPNAVRVLIAEGEADRSAAEDLRAFLAGRGLDVTVAAASRGGEPSDVVVALWSRAASTARDRLQVERRALDAWAEGRLILVELDLGTAPIGLRDLPRIDASSGADRTAAWGAVERALRNAVPPSMPAEAAETTGATASSAPESTNQPRVRAAHAPSASPPAWTLVIAGVLGFAVLLIVGAWLGVHSQRRAEPEAVSERRPDATTSRAEPPLPPENPRPEVTHVDPQMRSPATFEPRESVVRIPPGTEASFRVDLADESDAQYHWTVDGQAVGNANGRELSVAGRGHRASVAVRASGGGREFTRSWVIEPLASEPSSAPSVAATTSAPAIATRDGSREAALQLPVLLVGTTLVVGAVVAVVVLRRRRRSSDADFELGVAGPGRGGASAAPAYVEPDPGQMFVSYAHADYTLVERIVAAVEAQGTDMWLDRPDIHPGRTWAAEIVRAIKGARTVIVMCSPRAFESDNVKREVYLADRYKKRMLPVYLEASQMPEDFEYFFAGVQSLDLYALPDRERPTALFRALA
jgi:hypothetical protein